MLKVNNVVIKTPSSFQVDISDIDGESNRNARGELIRDRIAVKRKLNCSWQGLTDAEIKSILSAITDTFFTVEYPDPLVGGLTTKTFYVGDRNAPMYNYKLHIWEGLTCNFIEK